VHSLATLNSYSNESITFFDDRPLGIRYLFDDSVNQTITINEDETHPAQLGNDIVELVNCREGNVVYRIDVTALPNTSVTWDSLPSGITSSEVNGVYSINGITLVKDWEQVKSPTITMPIDYSGIWTYTSSLILDGQVDQSWITTVTAVEVDNLSRPNAFFYTAGTTQVITGTPIVQDPTSDTYTLITSVGNPEYVVDLTVSGTGGEVTSNTTTKTITITASRTEINNYLANLTLTTPSGLEADFLINYSLLNPITSTFSNVSQGIGGLVTNVLSRPNVAYYTQNITSLVISTPTILDPIGITPSTNYLLKIAPITSDTVSNLFTTSTNSNVAFYSGNVTLNLFGTKNQINQDLGNLFVTPATDFDQNFILSYGLFDGNVEISRRNQDLLIGTVIAEIDNITFGRTFVENTVGLLFTQNIPVINEDPGPGDPIYTINFSAGPGKFGLNDVSATSSYSFSGTKAQCNAIFELIKFYPTRDITGNQTFNYKQSRDGVEQLTITVALIGVNRTLAYPNVTYTITSTQTFTLTYEEAIYLNKDILLVGAGGAGGTGGGGGGEVIEILGITSNFALGSTTINIGSGPSDDTSAYGYVGRSGQNGADSGGNGGNGSLGGAPSGTSSDGTGSGILYRTGGGGGGSIAGNNGNGGGGNGAPGSLSTITGNYYGGGGGGLSLVGGIAVGGIGGGGNGGNRNSNISPTGGAVNSGGGGGGGLSGAGLTSPLYSVGPGGGGGSGIVVIRFYR
jgi:hypothetical protein